MSAKAASWAQAAMNNSCKPSDFGNMKMTACREALQTDYMAETCLVTFCVLYSWLLMARSSVLMIVATRRSRSVSKVAASPMG